MNERMIAGYSCGWSEMLGERNAFDNDRNVQTILVNDIHYTVHLHKCLKQHLMCTIMLSIKVECTNHVISNHIRNCQKSL